MVWRRRRFRSDQIFSSLADLSNVYLAEDLSRSHIYLLI